MENFNIRLLDCVFRFNTSKGKVNAYIEKIGKINVIDIHLDGKSIQKYNYNTRVPAQSTAARYVIRALTELDKTK